MGVCDGGADGGELFEVSLLELMSYLADGAVSEELRSERVALVQCCDDEGRFAIERASRVVFTVDGKGDF